MFVSSRGGENAQPNFATLVAKTKVFPYPRRRHESRTGKMDAKIHCLGEKRANVHKNEAVVICVSANAKAKSEERHTKLVTQTSVSF